MRNYLDEKLLGLNNSLIKMAATVEEAINLATKALVEKNISFAEKAIELEDKINNQEKEIEAVCLNLLLMHHPVAGDLRQISSALKMITDMERIGDHAEDISRLVMEIVDEEYIKKIEYIPVMSDIINKMLKECIDAFIEKDINLAKKVIRADDVVDDLFRTIKKDILALIVSNVENSRQGLDLLMISKYYERIGDHAVNIAEWVVFSITGEHRY